MKSVHKFQILGNPTATAHNPTEACPQCGDASFSFQDGSVMCIGHGCFEPERSDVRLFPMRQQFDRRHGITGDDRGLLATKVAESPDAALAERNRINERIRLTALARQPRL